MSFLIKMTIVLPVSDFFLEHSPSQRICHVLCQKPMALFSFIENEFALPTPEVEILASLGCIYLNKKRQSSDILLSPGDYIRFHHDPKRYDLSLFQPQHCLLETTDFFLVNKPAGLPVHATLDNSQEHLLQALETFSNGAAYVTHRLDVVTSGLLVVARTKEFQKRFNGWLQKKVIQKFYRAYVEGRCETQGLIEHYMEPSPRAPKVLQKESKPSWQICQLILTPLGCHQLANKEVITEVQIELLTGRTHQIRAQLAKLGHPIVGDEIYGSRWSLEKTDRETIALHSERMTVKDKYFKNENWQAQPEMVNPYWPFKAENLKRSGESPYHAQAVPSD